ncbi:MAG: GNAT family N-acetyltransferase [Fimbriimonadaceae bacterium]|nr:GNAT family N-acetyltransferase [Fimbriimonadaceae bacterium]
MTGRHPLDNPVWSALSTRHAAMAVGGGSARRYPADFGPFVAVGEPSERAEQEAADLVAPGESMVFGAVAPALSSAWRLDRTAAIVQMVYEGPRREGGDPRVVRLGEADIPAMVELTEMVYPAYFRAGTARAGAFFGVKQEGRLAAMAGTRFRMDGYTEVTAVCTHPGHLGQGLASLLVAHTVAHIQAEGDQPFLHVDDDNHRAIGVYERLDFRPRWTMPLWGVTRV